MKANYMSVHNIMSPRAQSRGSFLCRNALSFDLFSTALELTLLILDCAPTDIVVIRHKKSMVF